MKNYSILFVITLLVLSCSEPLKEPKQIEVTGNAQGTTYQVLYISSDHINYQRAIDSLLIVIDNSMSTYNKSSLISKWNKSESGVDFKQDEHFSKVYNISKEMVEQTKGSFDPTVAPLVNAWGFGFEHAGEIDTTKIMGILQLVGFDSVLLTDGRKNQAEVMLDFNAVAQGYTVDVLGQLLEQRGITNYLVEVGGELRAKGLNMNDTLWRVGIDRPIPDLAEREMEAIIHLQDKSIATSGNYRKFYEKDGLKYAHTIDPRTGYPVEHNLLSATVVADDCARADALATAFMVMGLEKAKTFLASHSEYEALLIFAQEDGTLGTFTTDGLDQFIELNPDKK